jgi:hypothetical protein
MEKVADRQKNKTPAGNIGFYASWAEVITMGICISI